MTTVSVELASRGKMLTEGRTNYSGDFTVFADEPPLLGGEGSAPLPLDYLLLSVGFCLLTQVALCAKALKVGVESSKATVHGRFEKRGSILAGTVEGVCEEVSVELTLTSPDDPGRVAEVVRLAESACFVSSALANPVPVRHSTVLNGRELLPAAS